MKVAVVGSGISGLASAYYLQRFSEVTIFEAESRLGGHTDTHQIDCADKTFHVDTGFIVFNQHNYPKFCHWLGELGIQWQSSHMSFSVRDTKTDLEYGTGGIDAFFAQRRNIFSPAHYRMFLDVYRFYRRARHDLQTGSVQGSLKDYLAQESFGERFVPFHLGPMCGALWSQEQNEAISASAAHVLEFMGNHRMLQLIGRPQWCTVSGGSGAYLSAFERQFLGRIQLGAPVRSIRRTGSSVHVIDDNGCQEFDAMILCVHSDQALALLERPTNLEIQILGAIRYGSNRVVLHSDASFMPYRRRTWSSWNAVVDPESSSCSVTYWMNRLQNLVGHPFFVTLNPSTEPASTWVERNYAHPIFDGKAKAAQKQKHKINGLKRVFYAGAYWGWGFHEDGIRSAIDSVKHLRGASTSYA
ncbi:MAG: dehydrogenase [Gammaproteobacteria bacterium]|jgi:predicted NAD/FAD-binding protein|nr:dehydrogenase [Gammaproteobacteria bacterium]|tara:strand:+ start:2767 stop:4008 length:1242 start_codon:yes stop_codon:yes gene_type:complete